MSDPSGSLRDVPPSDRAVPPLIADERATLAGWLDFYRATLAEKCHGLDDDGWRAASVPPSPLTLLGLVAHLAEVERNWFRRVLLGEDVPPIYDSPSSTTAGSTWGTTSPARRRWSSGGRRSSGHGPPVPVVTSTPAARSARAR
jgi:hypothetical protein